MEKKQFDLREVRHIINLSESYRKVKYDGFVLVDPEKATNLLEALRRYSTVFELQIGRLERQLIREKEAQDVMGRLIIEKSPFTAMLAAGMTDLEYRKQCVELYESLSDQKREELLR